MENLQQIKTLSITSVLCLVGGMMMPALLNQVPTIAKILKWALIPIGLILMAFVLILLITQGKGFSFKKKDPTPPKTYEERMTEANQKLYEEQINTQIHIEKKRQAELQNVLEMERAKIEQEKAKANILRNKNGGNQGSLIGNMDDFIRMPKNSDPIRNLGSFASMNKDNHGLDRITTFSKKQKRQKQKRQPSQQQDNFFKWGE